MDGAGEDDQAPESVPKRLEDVKNTDELWSWLDKKFGKFFIKKLSNTQISSSEGSDIDIYQNIDLDRSQYINETEQENEPDSIVDNSFVEYKNMDSELIENKANNGSTASSDAASQVLKQREGEGVASDEQPLFDSRESKSVGDIPPTPSPMLGSSNALPDKISEDSEHKTPVFHHVNTVPALEEGKNLEKSRNRHISDEPHNELDTEFQAVSLRDQVQQFIQILEVRKKILKIQRQLSEQNEATNVNILVQSLSKKETEMPESPSSSPQDDYYIERMEYFIKSDKVDVEDLVQKIEESMACQISTAEVIGKKGGSIELRRCKISFLPKAFEKKTAVLLAIGLRNDDSPDDYVAISLSLRCNTSNVKFRGFADVTMPIYYKADVRHMMVLCKKTPQSEWEKIEAKIAIDGNAATFQVSHFCWYKIFIPSWLTTGKILLVNQLFYHEEKPLLCALTCVNDGTTLPESCTNLEKRGYKIVLPFADEIVLRKNQKMSYTMQCTEPPESKVTPEDRLPVSLTRAVFRNQKRDWRLFNLSPAPQNGTIWIRFILNKPNEDPKESDVPLQWNQGQCGAQMPDGDSIADATAAVERVEVRGCGQRAHRDINNNDVYQIGRLEKDRMALIINNSCRGTRSGSEVDFENMWRLWKALGFAVKVVENLSAEGMADALKQFVKAAEKATVVIIVIMSHGGKTENEREYFCGEDRLRLFTDDIIAIFSTRRAPCLRGIPKLFLFQACRGQAVDVDGEEADAETEDTAEKKETFPERADTVVSFATQSGFKALRHREYGSWYINAITNVFKKAREMHVLEMLTIVNKKVADNITEDRQIQISSQHTSLRKLLYLFPGCPTG